MEIVRKEFKLNTVGTLSVREILPQSIADLAQSLHNPSNIVHVQIETNHGLTQQAYYSYSILPGRTIGNKPGNDAFREIDVQFGIIKRQEEKKNNITHQDMQSVCGA